MKLKSDDSWMLVYRQVTLIFRTVHWDKAGETSSCRVVKADVADVTGNGIALLVTRNGIPVHVPVATLFRTRPPDAAVEAQVYIGGHELIRDFHPKVSDLRTVQRWLDREEVEELLEQARQTKPVRGGNKASRGSRSSRRRGK